MPIIDPIEVPPNAPYHEQYDRKITFETVDGRNEAVYLGLAARALVARNEKYGEQYLLIKLDAMAATDPEADWIEVHPDWVRPCLDVLNKYSQENFCFVDRIDDEPKDITRQKVRDFAARLEFANLVFDSPAILGNINDLGDLEADAQNHA